MTEADSKTHVPPTSGRKFVLAERNDLALAWVAATVLGAVFISYAPEEGALRMLLPLFAMAAFAGFALSRSRYSTPKVADSVYFMGFIWTLWALIDVLIVGNRQLTSAQLYIAFGYALTATTAGMFIRLLLLQFYRSIDDQEQEAVDAIDDRAALLTREWT